MTEFSLEDDSSVKVNVLKRRLYFVAWFFIIGGIACIICALATPHWRGDTEYNEGIFQRCMLHKCDDVILFEGTEPEIDSVRIISLLSIGYIAISIFLGVFSIANRDVITVLRALSFLHVIIAFTVYTAVNANKPKLWAFYLGWSGAGIYGLGFILGAISSHCMKDPGDDEKSNSTKT